MLFPQNRTKEIEVAIFRLQSNAQDFKNFIPLYSSCGGEPDYIPVGDIKVELSTNCKYCGNKIFIDTIQCRGCGAYI
jgi:hypothetical protein